LNVGYNVDCIEEIIFLNEIYKNIKYQKYKLKYKSLIIVIVSKHYHNK
jgi:hypothetical protein